MRRLVCLLLLCCLPLHALAMQGRGLSNPSESIAHALEHLHEISHHHHADGAVHYDESEESSQHAAETAGSGSLSAILPALANAIALASSSIGPAFALVLLPDAIPAVPIRPPSAIG